MDFLDPDPNEPPMRSTIRNDALAFVAGALSAAGLAVAILSSQPQTAAAADITLVPAEMQVMEPPAAAVSLDDELARLRFGATALLVWLKDAAAGR